MLMKALIPKSWEGKCKLEAGMSISELIILSVILRLAKYVIVWNSITQV
jgi:hypothetical protein